MPPESRYLLDWFFQLSGLHTSGMAVNPLQPSEVEAWFRLMKIEPTPWEADTIFRMDAAFLERMNSKSKGRKSIAKADVNDPQAITNLMNSFVHRKPNGSMIARNGR